MAGKGVSLDEAPPPDLVQTQVIGVSSIPVMASTSALTDSAVKLPSMIAGSGLSPQVHESVAGDIANNASSNKKARSAMELKVARESRANEALKMKDDQLRILTDQNSQVIGAIVAKAFISLNASLVLSYP